MRGLFSHSHSLEPAKLAVEALFTGEKILLVEDNPINLKVATAILEWLGCAVTDADSGAKAIERLRIERDIGLVLMDCQMPDMDGFETARIIRAMQTEGEIPRTPVIALTAFAMKGDRERCLEAGMDDYLAKPLRKEALGDMLVKWLKKPTGTPDNGRSVARSDIELGDTPFLDRPTLDEVRSLMGVRFEDVLQLYFKDTYDRIRMIEQLLVPSGDAKSIVLQAHSIKSASAYMGAARLAAAAGDMEISAQDAVGRHKDADGLAPLVQEIRNIFAETRRNFRRIDEKWARD